MYSYTVYIHARMQQVNKKNKNFFKKSIDNDFYIC